MSEIIRKLKLDTYQRTLVLNLPEGVSELDGLSFDTEAGEGSYDLIFAFVFDLRQMEERIRETAQKNLLSVKGYLFFAYPKKGNKQYPGYIHRDSIFPTLGVSEEDGYVAGTPLKFSRMVSLNDTFTVVGLKHLPLKKG